ncbi:enoyl-CoA hydratase/isomerase family protein [Aeromicrobium fastidiosum]|uniref:Enoyl-CoA hydratase n=1 Tax=Aeromicrobium fastidiosum TaxID=52699 RepID=A0A641AHA6_9ACTN|nr:enoyl-CoA hydratase-related protein [Aeromicrobium fastidiosum]KAA1373055.1 enoyl-CoA hydratase [Aeromicrobium fastidiosum]MBP2391036.1 2-(1,2-epoxy-1,2-dihydrophenyl)acetyl-CoA isomerase [Aeromicrobium fastidiosum]
MTEPVVIDRDAAVATVTIDRADRRNALDRPTKIALRRALDEVAADPAVRAVVLTGAGSAFCVGQDLGEHAAALEDDAGTAFATVDEHYNPIVMALATMPKPVIAAVNGMCVGAGLGFALACDLRVLAAGASLGTAFSAIGLTCDSGLSSTLSRAVGESRAKELVLLARPFSSEDAVAWGISGEVVPGEDVLSSAQALATRLAAGPTAAYAASKRAIADAWTMTLPEVLRAERAAQQALGLTADHQGAVAAFLAKQKPAFTGR